MEGSAGKVEATGLSRAAGVLLGLYAAYYLFLGFAVSVPSAVDGVPDDAFYYLQVARNVALGHGSSFDGVEPTNGYHPLWLGLLVPVYALTGPDSEIGMRGALGLSILLGMGILIWLREIARREIGPFGALLALLLMAWPRFFGQTVNLLETGLLLFLYLTIIGLHSRFASDGAGFTPRREFLFGIVVGLACLARLDTVFLLLAFGIAGLVSAVRHPSGDAGIVRRAWRNVRFLCVAVGVVAPYLFWNLQTFGHLQPISGAMKSSFPNVQLTFRYVTEFPEFGALFLVGVGYALAWLRRGSPVLPPPKFTGNAAASAPTLPSSLAIFGMAAAFHLGYTVCFMQWGVDRWHYGLLLPIGLLGLPHLVTRLPLHRVFAGAPWLPWTVVVLGTVGAVLVQVYSFRLREGRYGDVSREVALWAQEHLPADAVFATTDAGVFGYFSERTTINLDGLINNYRYREEVRAGRFAAYLRDRGVQYILDQYSAGNEAWVSGEYESRPYRVWFHPEHRVAGQVTLFREDEVYRVIVQTRTALASAEREPNAIVMWRFHPEKQTYP